jgi:hypothetical protein
VSLRISYDFFHSLEFTIPKICICIFHILTNRAYQSFSYFEQFWR